MAKIIVTGSRGQLGRALLDLAPAWPQHSLTGIDLEHLDLCDTDAVERFFFSNPADVVVNCAAYTAVDKAEEEPEKAFALNSSAVKVLAGLSEKLNFRLIHISTDYIFDGNSPLPCHEEQGTNPQSVYGQSKLEGEIGVLFHTRNAFIIRTSWLYYPGGKNFVNTILQLATQRKPLRIVYDQTGSPTFAGDLAGAIMEIIEQHQKIDEVTVYHYANRGVTTWYDFARTITELAGIHTEIEPVLTPSLKQPASRPAYSVMNCDKIIRDYSITIPHWKDGLIRYLKASELLRTDNQHDQRS